MLVRVKVGGVTVLTMRDFHKDPCRPMEEAIARASVSAGVVNAEEWLARVKREQCGAGRVRGGLGIEVYYGSPAMLCECLERPETHGAAGFCGGVTHFRA